MSKGERIALISVIGTIVVAFVSQLGTCHSNRPTTDSRASQQELIDLINDRADDLISNFDKDRQSILDSVTNASTKESLLNAKKSLQKVDSVEKTFKSLHGRNVDAIRTGQNVRSHELTNQIHTILDQYYRPPGLYSLKWDSGVIVSPLLPSPQTDPYSYAPASYLNLLMVMDSAGDIRIKAHKK